MISMNLSKRVAVMGIVAASTALSGSVWAAPITLNFVGAVTQTSFDPFDPLMGAVTVGSPLYSFLNFDTNAVDATPSPDLGSYTLSGFPYGFSPFASSVAFPLMRTVNISIVNGVAGGPDQYSVFASEGTASGLGDYFSMSILLDDATGTALSSDALPASMPDLSHFALRTFLLTGQYTSTNNDFIQYEIQGNVTVPEPGTVSLVALALFGCATTARRSRCSR